MASLAHRLAQQKPLTVLDVGCGPGSFAIELAKACEASITAVDTNPLFLERAREAAAAESLRGRIEFVEQPASEITDRKFDAVVCIGSSHAFGLPVEALRHCASLLTPGGVVLFADLVWSAEPPAKFVAFLGMAKADFWMASAAADVFAEAGLVVKHTETAGEESWKNYEDGVMQGRLAFAETLDAAAAEAARNKAAAWAEAYDKFGRHCFGFEAYLASKSGG